MMPAEAWRRLGIAPTDDVRAIRRAYADTLRGLDADAAPAVFMALRDARDTALATKLAPAANDDWDAEWQPFEADDDDDDDDGPVADDRPDPRVLDGWDGRSRDSALWGDPREDAPPPAADTVFLRNPRDDDQSDRTTGDTPLYAGSDGDHHAEPRPTPTLDANGARPDPATPDTPLFDEIEDGRFHEPRPTPVLDARGPRVVAKAAPVVAAPEPGPLLHGLLTAEHGDVPLTPGELEEARVLLGAIARDAEASTIERHADIDEWIANLLARNTPRADPLIATAGKLFGWEARTNDLFLPSALDHLVARQRGLNFVAMVRDRKHPLHKAWSELRRPATDASRLGWFVNKSEIARLLAVVRRDHPFVEDEFFDSHRVARWEARIAPRQGGLKWLWITVLILIAVVRIIAAVADDPKPVGARPVISAIDQLRTVDDDIDEVLGKLTPQAPQSVELATVNPKLRDFLGDRWRAAKRTRTSRDGWLTVYETIVRDKVYANTPRYGFAVLAAGRGYERDTMREMLTQPMGNCEAQLTKGPPQPSGLDDKVWLKLRAKHEAFLGLAMREVDPAFAPPVGPTTFTVPGPVMTRVLKLSGLSDGRLRAALQQKGTRPERCAARIALIDAALEQPRAVALPILRGM